MTKAEISWTCHRVRSIVTVESGAADTPGSGVVGVEVSRPGGILGLGAPSGERARRARLPGGAHPRHDAGRLRAGALRPSRRDAVSESGRAGRRGGAGGGAG